MGKSTIGIDARACVLASCLLVFGCGGKEKEGGGPGGTAGDGDGDGDQSEPEFCEDNDECSDDVFCNGEERCNPDHEDADAFGCLPAADEPCSEGDACSESNESCGCADADADGDGHDSVACGGDDCDDDDANRFPGNSEVCDADDHDEDCNAETYGFRDQDGDDDPDDECCNEDESGDLNCGDDCNDNRANQHSFNTEVCDDIDNDCDGLVDETIDGDEDDGLKMVFTVDADNDGRGSDDPDADSVFACEAPEGYVPTADDCDDDDNQISPESTEVCDDVDNDCDGLTDETINGTEDDGLKAVFTIDADGDNFGSAADDAETVLACSAPPGYVTTTSDCDDDAADVSPGAFDSCTDDIDNDCSGDVNDPPGGCDCTGNISQSCAVPGDEGGPGLVGLCATSNRTCVNGDWENCGIMPNSQSEVCDAVGVDEDCDGKVNEATNIVDGGGNQIDDSMKETFYRDRDGDGYPDLSTSAQYCPDLEPAGWISNANAEDCVDELLSENPLSDDINPGATEVCNGRDDNCDNIVDGLSSNADLETTFYYDGDNDGQAGMGTTMSACTDPGARWHPTAQDCNDDDVTIYLGAQETCDGVDEDCDSVADVDDVQAANNCDVTGQIASAVCAVDECMVDECSGAYLDCDTSYDCETDGSADLDHCGECGNACYFACGGTPASPSCSEISSLGLGWSHSCAVFDGRLACWGEGGEDQLGNSSATNRFQPYPVSVLSDVVQVVGGGAHTCAIEDATERDVYCWGEGSSGQLGTNSTGSEPQPELVTALSGVVSLSAGQNHTCAITSGNSVMCWGQSEYGRLGDRDLSAGAQVVPTQCSEILYSGTTPTGLGSVTSASKLAAGTHHTCLLKTNGTVYCAGRDNDGQNGNTAATPAGGAGAFERVSGLSGVDDLSAGAAHNCVIVDGDVYCWGNNAEGQCGQSTSADVLVPTQVMGISNAESLALGLYFSCARITGGTVMCWGTNFYGEAGDSSADDFYQPQTVSGLASVTALAAGGQHTCAQEGGLSQVSCWGANLSGQLGIGSFDSDKNYAPAPLEPLDE